MSLLVLPRTTQYSTSASRWVRRKAEISDSTAEASFSSRSTTSHSSSPVRSWKEASRRLLPSEISREAGSRPSPRARRAAAIQASSSSGATVSGLAK